MGVKVILEIVGIIASVLHVRMTWQLSSIAYQVSVKDWECILQPI